MVGFDVPFQQAMFTILIAAGHTDNALSGTCYVLRESEVGVTVKYMLRAYAVRPCHEQCLDKTRCLATLVTCNRVKTYCQVRNVKMNSTLPSSLLSTTDTPSNHTSTTKRNEHKSEDRRGKQPYHTLSRCKCPQIIQDEIMKSPNERLLFYYQKEHPFGLYIYMSRRRSFESVEGVSCATMSNMHFYNCRLFYAMAGGAVKSICVDGQQETTLRRSGTGRKSVDLKYDVLLNAALVIERASKRDIHIIKFKQNGEVKILHTLKKIPPAYFELDTISQNLYFNSGTKLFFVSYNSKRVHIKYLASLTRMAFSPSFDEHANMILGELSTGFDILDRKTLKRKRIRFSDRKMDQYSELCYFRGNIFLFYANKIHIVNLEVKQSRITTSSSGKKKCIPV